MKSTLARIDYLDTLCRALPPSLPFDPQISTYYFVPDAEMFQEEPWRTFNHCLEVAFQTWQIPKPQMIFTESGHRLCQLSQTLREMVSVIPLEHQFLCDIWVEPLISAAIRSGALAPEHPAQSVSKGL
jgi:hypothetical protein